MLQAVPELKFTANTLVSSREKVVTVARKILLYFYFHNKGIFDLKKILVTIGGETKKILEVIFILEGVGLIMRVSKSKFFFQGFEGMIQKFQSKVKSNSNRLCGLEKEQRT